MLCFFPLTGAVLGGISSFAFLLMTRLGMGNTLKAAVLCTVPIFVTGGIHMDGFLDTIDARSSYGERERKLAILKDSHTGAFAIIYGVLYEILSFGFFTEITPRLMGFIALGYIFSRALSGLGAVTFKQARTEGTLAEFSLSAHRLAVIVSMAAYLMAAGLSMVCLAPVYGGACIGVSFMAFLYYKQMAYREFGGITGDIAGYFVQICELAILITIVLLKYAGV